jgi:hypothetical protein
MWQALRADKNATCMRAIQLILLTADNCCRAPPPPCAPLTCSDFRAESYERHGVFRKWADVNDSNTKVLFLKAKSGYGKTHVSNYIFTHLQKKYKAGAGPN